MNPPASHVSVSRVVSSCIAVVAASMLFAVTPGCSSDTAAAGKTSSTDAGHGGSAGDDDDGSAGGGNTGSDASTCSCDVTYNNVEKVLRCGESGCVNGEQYSCSSASGAIDQGACSAASDASVDAAGHDAGDAGRADAAPTCVAQGNDCSSGGTCCAGTYCGLGNEVCVIDLGSACTSASQCESADPPVSPGASCTGDVCCGNPGYPCVTEGPDAECCSGSCGAPNQSGISFCE